MPITVEDTAQIFRVEWDGFLRNVCKSDILNLGIETHLLFSTGF
jgi:hypothetical protein